LHRRGIDGRGRDARRFRDVFERLAQDAAGGESNLSEAERALARTAASLAVKAEAMQAQVAAGQEVDAEQLVRVSNSLSRVLAQLRAKQKPRDAGPSLADYLAATHAEATK
jgi:hypothetical protein